MMKFEELAEAWLEDYQKSVKHKTYINAKQAIENHLYPHFAGIAIDKKPHCLSGVFVTLSLFEIYIFAHHHQPCQPNP